MSFHLPAFHKPRWSTHHLLRVCFTHGLLQLLSLAKNQQVLWNISVCVCRCCEKGPDLDICCFFLFVCFLREDNANRQRSKNPVTSPSGGRSANPPFSGPYPLNTWSRGFSYHEIPYMIYMVENMKHFNCAHACWFLHNVPTENDDVRIISCSLCRAITQPLCQKGLGDRGWGWFPGLRLKTNPAFEWLTSHSVWGGVKKSSLHLCREAAV